ncbi:hypothetical protein GCM10022206_03220 [Streptomyces chiangmaiensis]
MDQIWVVLIGSVAAGIVALGYVCIGIIGGRRQTAGQADVAHGQRALSIARTVYSDPLCQCRSSQAYWMIH